MSRRKTHRQSQKQPPEQPTGLTAETRIDPPHVEYVSQPEVASAEPSAAPADEDQQSAAPVNAAKIDVAGPVAEAVAAEMAKPVVPPENVAERFRVQAEQLAAHLRTRQKEIDHREAQLNARLAEAEREERRIRLWASERDAELKRRAEEAGQQEREMQSRLERLAAAEAAQREQAAAVPPPSESETPPAAGPTAEQAEMQERAETLDRAREQLDSERQHLQADARQVQSERQELELQRQQFEAERQQLQCERQRLAVERQESEAQRQRAASAWTGERQQFEEQREAAMQQVAQLVADVERRREAVESQVCQTEEQRAKAEQELLAREALLRQSSAALAVRQQQLDEAESRLSDAWAEIEQLREQLSTERRDSQEDARSQRQQLAAEHRRTLDELEKKRQAVQRRADHVDRCRLALRQLRGELGRMHRETLEIRLATEELWVQLSGAAPPAALTHSLGRIRSKLADHYRLATAELQEQKTELENLRNQMSAQYEKLVQQKRNFEQWADAQRDESQQHAARLMAREEELREKEAAFDDRAHRWQSERLQFQHEIRRLQARTPRQTEATLTA